MKNISASDLREIHNDTFKKISGQYDQIQDVITASFSAPSREFCKDRLKGKNVLDVGNGGISKEKLLGKDLASQVKNFVAVDQCFEMLDREHFPGEVKVAADAFHLPFADKSFDYVLLNGMIHHIGYRNKVESNKKIATLFQELQRVCKNDIIVTEIFVSPILEFAERMVAFLLGYMHTFVLSEKTVDTILKSISTRKENTQIKTLTQLSKWNYWYLILLEYPWFKLPAFLNPFQWAFFTVPATKLSGSENQNAADQLQYCCPKCKAPLFVKATSYDCSSCLSKYPLRNGIVVFI